MRTTAEPSITVNGFESGSPRLQKTVLPVEAQANLSIRLARASRPRDRAGARAAPPRGDPGGASLEVELWSTGEPGFVDPAAPAVRIAQDAFEHVLGTRPVLTRSGGSIPVVAALGARGVPAIVTGFTRPTSQLHSPNEQIPASALRDGLDDDGRAAPTARGAWLTRATRARSPRSSPRRCSSGSCATS